MKLKRIDHIGVVVADLAEASALLEGDLELVPEETIEREDINAAFFACDDTRIEVIQVLGAEERQARLGDRRARVEHIAFEVDDLEETIRALAALGIEMTGPPGIGGKFLTAFTVPESSGGIMLQFSQRA